MIKSVLAYVSPSKPVKTTPISRKVAVTGAGGYIGSHVVDALLRDPDGRFEVVGTVRSLKDDTKIEHLYALPNAKQKLTLVEADLLNPESLEAAFEGCDFVLHVASPFIMTTMKAVKNAEERIVKPAVEGTKAVMRAANACGVQKVVVTSSVFAIYGRPNEKGVGHTFTEEDWNTSSTLDDAYALSKKLAEMEAWKLAAELELELAVINPSLVLGPPLSKRVDGESVNFMRDILSGKFQSGVPRTLMAAVDVRDVAMAHVRAMLDPKAKGRYICSNKTIELKGLCDLLTPEYKGWPLPKAVVPKWLVKLMAPLTGMATRESIENTVGIDYDVSNTRLTTGLGLHLRPLKETVIDMTKAMVDLKMVTPPEHKAEHKGQHKVLKATKLGIAALAAATLAAKLRKPSSDRPAGPKKTDPVTTTGLKSRFAKFYPSASLTALSPFGKRKPESETSSKGPAFPVASLTLAGTSHISRAFQVLSAIHPANLPHKKESLSDKMTKRFV
mmetsp:Transcript_9471/g.16282  ORF Transcript_9471/g.16282 Transcript_9471/m.16282 type:complete len:501 (+) Transcript_9471:114-1616(+)|eukprot:CAMPEP_0198201422 /NCGR_PEP_ID=MMETSP1445-20131203/4261_1 /TAXON_ID=36898 /ORGANISM="Pyramimonas sp., Strain CCMP2087" /LENGTH=500 /DNA_ID=CAMNT_0043871765 /DNA_START=80 /DNA_END=1582 /DNA_ORIENTATION=-